MRMKNSKQILSDHKVSITNPRILVIEALLENNNPLTVDELQIKLKNKVATAKELLNQFKMALAQVWASLKSNLKK